VSAAARQFVDVKPISPGEFEQVESENAGNGGSDAQRYVWRDGAPGMVAGFPGRDARANRHSDQIWSTRSAPSPAWW
jgi:hypothetical protein